MNSDGGWMNGNCPHHGLNILVLTACTQVNTCLLGAACTPFSIRSFSRNLGQHLVNCPPYPLGNNNKLLSPLEVIPLAYPLGPHT
jgi:hypothetical protein